MSRLGRLIVLILLTGCAEATDPAQVELGLEGARGPGSPPELVPVTEETLREVLSDAPVPPPFYPEDRPTDRPVSAEEVLRTYAEVRQPLLLLVHSSDRTEDDRVTLDATVLAPESVGRREFILPPGFGCLEPLPAEGTSVLAFALDRTLDGDADGRIALDSAVAGGGVPALAQVTDGTATIAGSAVSVDAVLSAAGGVR